MFHVIQFTTSQVVIFIVLCIMALAAMFFIGEVIGLLVAHDPRDWSSTNCPNPKLSKTALIHQIAEKFREFRLESIGGCDDHLPPWACGALARIAVEKVNEYLMSRGMGAIREDKIKVETAEGK